MTTACIMSTETVSSLFHQGVLKLPCTAIQSFASSSGGSFTTCFKSMPECNDALARLCKSNLVVPSAMFFFFSRNVCKYVNTAFMNDHICCENKNASRSQCSSSNTPTGELTAQVVWLGLRVSSCAMMTAPQILPQDLVFRSCN